MQQRIADLEAKLAALQKENKRLYRAGEAQLREKRKTVESERELFAQLAASQAREKQMRDTVEAIAKAAKLNASTWGHWIKDQCGKGLALPTDDTALREYVAPLEARVKELEDWNKCLAKQYEPLATSVDAHQEALRVAKEALEVLKLKCDPKYGWPVINDALAKIEEVLK